MNQKIKFGTLALFLSALPLLSCYAQQQSAPAQTDSAGKALKKEWRAFMQKQEANQGRGEAQPGLNQEYNRLVEQLETQCDSPKAKNAPSKTKPNVEGEPNSPRPCP
jgi:hypothetical protein